LNIQLLSDEEIFALALLSKTNNLRTVREKEGLTLVELGNLSAVSLKTIYILESGLRDTKQVTKYRILNGLNKNPNRTCNYRFEDVFPND